MDSKGRKKGSMIHDGQMFGFNLWHTNLKALDLRCSRNFHSRAVELNLILQKVLKDELIEVKIKSDKPILEKLMYKEAESE